MLTDAFRHLCPTLDIIAEALCASGMACHAVGAGTGRRFRGVRLFPGAGTPEPDVLYVLRPGDIERFPGGPHACAVPEPLPGDGPQLVCPGRSWEAVLDALLSLFARCRDMEAELDGLVYARGNLSALCELTARLLGNPVCVHDDWFVMAAKSAELNEAMPPDSIMASSREYLPRRVIEDFKDDPGSPEPCARLREGSPHCLYVNLWEGDVYRGRLMAVEHRRPFTLQDRMVAEAAAQRALTLLYRGRQDKARPRRGMDDIVGDLLSGSRPAAQEEARLLDALGWRRGDWLLCARLAPQGQDMGVVLAHALHSDLFQTFPGSYVLLAQGQQCVVLNLDRTGESEAMLRHRLAPLCRDYCLYAGMSSPVKGPEELHIADRQARAALDRVFQLRSDRWILHFSECALEYLLAQLQKDMEPRGLAAPELRRLMAYDRERGTRYYETLRAYLMEERDIPRAAKALIIHRTTLLYRLKKLRDIAHIDMDSPRQRLYLLLSLFILDAADDGPEPPAPPVA